MNWQVLKLNELSVFQETSRANELLANNYSALNCFLYSERYKSFVCVENGWIFERYEVNGETCYSFPHRIDGKTDGIDEALLKIKDDSKNFGDFFKIRNCLSKEKTLFRSVFPYAEIVENRDLGDYLYLSENLSNLPGKKYSKKRNHISRFQNKYSNFSFDLLNDSNAKDVLQVEKEWLSEVLENANSRDKDALENEFKMISMALDKLNELKTLCEISGGILYVDEKPVAFCLSSVLNPLVTDIHFEKCLSEYADNGGYAVINKEFAKTVSTKFINREEDLGIEGLRKAKLSYYPEIILEKFSAMIKI